MGKTWRGLSFLKRASIAILAMALLVPFVFLVDSENVRLVLFYLIGYGASVLVAIELDRELTDGKWMEQLLDKLIVVEKRRHRR